MNRNQYLSKEIEYKKQIKIGMDYLLLYFVFYLAIIITTYIKVEEIDHVIRSTALLFDNILLSCIFYGSCVTLYSYIFFLPVLILNLQYDYKKEKIKKEQYFSEYLEIKNSKKADIFIEDIYVSKKSKFHDIEKIHIIDVDYKYSEIKVKDDKNNITILGFDNLLNNYELF